jgi:CBS domain containing-hemolysin-like protein
VAVEFALVAVDRGAIDREAAEGDRRAAIVSRALSRLSFHLSGVQLGITITSLVLGFVAEPTVARALRGPLDGLMSRGAADAVSIVVALALATVVQMVVGELVPKAVAVSRSLGTARSLARPMAVYMRLFAPIIRLFGGLADRAVRLLGIEPAEELSTVRSRQELVTLVRRSRTEGTLDAAEAVLLTRAFRFGDKSAADALTPRTDIVSLRNTDSGADLLARSTATGLSRFPVVATDVDDIVGVVHVKALIDVPFAERATVAVAQLMSEPFVVPESRDLGHLLLEMREQRAQLAVVLDEYGGTAGIVTVEDLLEEIVGDIEDEHDPGRRTARPLGRTLLLPGGLHPDEVLDAVGFALPDGEFETLAGYLLDRLGHIPTVGEQVVDDGWTFTVVSMDRRRIETVQVGRPPSQLATGEAT